MSRAPGLKNDALVDANVQAHARGTLDRHFQASQMPRLTEAGIVEPAEIQLSVRFSIAEGRIAMAGRLGGLVTMTCQRCMRPVAIDMDDDFDLVIVADETEQRQVEEVASGHEPIVADAARLDMRWLAEEQALLNVPLIAKHADEQCGAPRETNEPPAKEEGASQRPFANLKDLLRDQK